MSAGHACRVLVVEDDAAAREATRRFLAFDGHQVEAVGDPGAALSAADASPPQVVVCDCNLAGEGDGVEVAQEIHARHGSAVILVSGLAPDQVLAHAPDLQPAACLLKPLSLQDLAAAVQDACA